MIMKLHDLLKQSYRHPLAHGHSYTIHGLEGDVDIDSLVADSRMAAAGSLFFAIRGTHSDAHQYVPSVVSQGVRAVVVESLPEELSQGVIYVQVADSRVAMGLIASCWWGHPSDKMTVVGVTGTNGKTTTATLLYKLFRQAGYSTGLLSTVCNYIDEDAVPSTHTTPGALELQNLFHTMCSRGCRYVFMEVSSHAIDQHRIAGVTFAGGIFTNLTRDHLDYHGTVKEYLYAKKAFFDRLPANAFALSNIDDRNAEVMQQNTQAHRLLYGLHGLADYKATILEQHPDCTELEIDGANIVVRLVGEFNMYNLLAVYATSRLLGLEKLETLRLLSVLTSVDGRLETFRSVSRGYTVFVDYAHTPDALVNVLESIRKLRGISNTQIICVVGCGGDRDRGKRPLMAAVSARLADKLILTSDNPRSEEPADIIAEMRTGLDSEALSRTLTIVDRKEAIRTACMLAHHGDYILIAGKGHETYQEIKGIKHPFDDREIVRSVINEGITTKQIQ